MSWFSRRATAVNPALPAPGPVPNHPSTIEELETHGLVTGQYNRPSWDNTREGFRRFLDSLFGITPPSALVIEESRHAIAALQFCNHRGIRIPENLSLVCCEFSPSLALTFPAISHLHWDYQFIVRRILRWTRKIDRGQKDTRQAHIEAKFFRGGTIGPVPAEKGTRPE